jgi:hypothetical protein
MILAGRLETTPFSFISICDCWFRPLHPICLANRGTAHRSQDGVREVYAHEKHAGHATNRLHLDSQPLANEVSDHE